jgi:hypothetical protein
MASSLLDTGFWILDVIRVGHRLASTNEQVCYSTHRFEAKLHHFSYEQPTPAFFEQKGLVYAIKRRHSITNPRPAHGLEGGRDFVCSPLEGSQKPNP